MSAKALTVPIVVLAVTVAMATALPAASERGDSADARPAQATPPGYSEWHYVDLGSFGVWLPPSWKYEERQGVDSFVGAFVGDGTELHFDYGLWSSPLPDPGQPGYDVTYEAIGGKAAKLVVADTGPAVLVGVHFREVTRDRVGCDQLRINKLTVSGSRLDAEQQATALAIYRSIHFPGLGEWVPVPVPTYPGTQSATLLDIDMVSADEGWAVGAQRDPEAEIQAAVMHYHDGGWRAMPSPTEDMLWAVDMVSPDEGWAVGGTSIVHYVDGAWTRFDDTTPNLLWDVEMVAPDDGWIVGIGVLLRYRDGQWQRTGGDGYFGAMRLNMLSPDDGWALGGSNPDVRVPYFHRFTDGQWRSIDWPLPTLSDPLTIEMSAYPSGTGWLGGGADDWTGWLARHCEDRYEPVTTTLPSTVWDIDMLDGGGTEGWAVGGNAEIAPSLLMHFDDDQWTVLDSPYDGYIKSIDMVTRDDGWAVGAYFGSDSSGGALLHYTGPGEPPPPGATATATPTASPEPTATLTPTLSPSPTPTPTSTDDHMGGIYLPAASKSLAGFGDGQWALKIDRAWDGSSGHIVFPSDPFEESDYQPVDAGPTYLVTVTRAAAAVAVGESPITGTRGSSSDGRVRYDLTEGTFAGGRLVVWSVGGGLQAELTIYGSGRPIISSERGPLLPDARVARLIPPAFD